MEVTVKSEKQNPILRRKEIEFEVNVEKSTPQRTELRKAVASHFKAKPELVVVDRITQRFGDRKASAIARIYEEKEALERLELGHIKSKNFPKQEAGKEKEKQEPAKEDKAGGKVEGKAGEKPAEEKEKQGKETAQEKQGEEGKNETKEEKKATKE